MNFTSSVGLTSLDPGGWSRKANWKGFESDTEDAFAAMSLPRDVRVGEQLFRCTLVKAAAKNIPAGHI